MRLLNERSNLVLNTVIKEYIYSAKPVSSKYLVRKYGFNLSSATLRNIMAGLEVDGLLTHPHTSAGRTPTIAGYRHYVNSISNNLSIGLEQRKFIIDFFTSNLNNEELLKETSKFVASLSSYLGLVFRYSSKKITVKHIDLISLARNQLLLVIITKNGEVYKSKVLIKKFDFDIRKLEGLFNKEFSNLDLASIIAKHEYLKALDVFGSLFANISQSLIDLLRKEEVSLYYDGIANLLNFPEFSKVELVSSMLNIFDNNEKGLANITENLKDNDTYVVIGDEDSSLNLTSLSLVASPYYQNESIAGAVGVIGPIRMNYEKAMATSHCIASSLTQALQQRH